MTRAPRQGGPGRPRPWTHTLGDRVKVTLSPLADDVGADELAEALRSALAALRKQGRGRAA